MRFYWFANGLAACLWLAVIGTASAQQADPQVQFNQAVELATAGDHAKAVDVCLDVLQKLPASEQPRVHKLLGYAYKKLDMLPEAWHHLTVYLGSSGKQDTTAGEWLQEVEAALKQSHVKVSFSCQPKGLTLNIPASKPGTASHLAFAIPNSAFAWWFKPGKHQVQADAADHESRTIAIDVRERGDSGVREVRLAAIVAKEEPVVVKTDPDPGNTTMVSKPASPENPSRALEWALIGSGVVLGVTGGIFHGLGYSKNEDLHDKYDDATNYPDGDQAKILYADAREEEVRPKEITAYALYGIGGAAIVAGIVTWAIREPGGDSGSAAFSVSPLAMPGGAGAQMTLGF
jgi:hypothetical protein